MASAGQPRANRCRRPPAPDREEAAGTLRFPLPRPVLQPRLDGRGRSPLDRDRPHLHEALRHELIADGINLALVERRM